MPALPAPLHAAGLHFEQSRNSAALLTPHLPWLVDRWAAPGWVPLANVYSVGDVLIALGGFLFALAATGALKRSRPRTGRNDPAPTALDRPISCRPTRSQSPDRLNHRTHSPIG